MAFDLATDPRVALIRDATKEGGGIAPEPAIVGTDEWWKLVGSDDLPLHTIEGVIEEVYWSGHNDFPEFTMRTTRGEVRTWERYGDHTLYVEGLAVRVMWITQRWTRPESFLGDTTDVVVRVDVEESDRRSAAEGRPAGGRPLASAAPLTTPRARQAQSP